MGATPKNAIPYPELSEPADVPADLKEMADKLDTFGYLPPGAMLMWPTAVAPTGFYLMVGQTNIPSAGNPTLAAIFGVTGAFLKMPDLRDLFLINKGVGSQLLSKGGESTKTLTVAELPTHQHPDTLAVASGGAHAHGASTDVAAANAQVSGYVPYSGGAFTEATGPSGSFPRVGYSTGQAIGSSKAYHDHPATTVVSSGGAHAHSLTGGVGEAGDQLPFAIMPPFYVINYIIRGG